jgi:hypothetical protein
VIDWLPHRVTFFLDGKTVGNTTNPTKIPNKLLRWIIQTNLSSSVAEARNTSQGHIYIDWAAIYAPG